MSALVQLTVPNFLQYSFLDFYYVMLDFLLMGHFSLVGDLCTVLLKWEFLKVPSHSALSSGAISHSLSFKSTLFMLTTHIIISPTQTTLLSFKPTCDTQHHYLGISQI